MFSSVHLLRFTQRIGFTGTLAVALASAHPAYTYAQTDALKIGHSAPLTGSNKALGEDIRDGALAFFKTVNDAGGINGRKIELVSIDDANEAKRAGENAKKLIDEGVIALFGYASATVSRPALPHVDTAKLAFFAPFTGADSMRGFNRYVYNVRASYADELSKIVNHYATLGSKTFAVVYYDDAVGKENLTAVERALTARNMKSVANIGLSRQTPDIASAAATLAKIMPDVVIQTTLYKASADLVKAAKAQKVNAQFVNNSFASATALAQELGKDGVGLTMTRVVPPYQQRTIPIVAEFLKNWAAAFPAKPPSFTSLEAYIAAKVLAEGVRRAGKQITRESLMSALDGMNNFDTGGYVVSFSPTNHNGSAYSDLTFLNRELRFSY
jgi:branched-chain amino acid transport system substrate-binding protein